MMAEGFGIFAIVQTDNQAVVRGKINTIRNIVTDGENEVTAVEAAESNAASAIEDQESATRVESVDILRISGQKVLSGSVELDHSVAGGNAPLRLTRRSVKSHQALALGDEVDVFLRDGGPITDRCANGGAPEQSSAGGLKGIQVRVLRTHIGHTVEIAGRHTNGRLGRETVA